MKLRSIMSVRMKKRHIETDMDTITIMGKRFIAPKKTIKAILTLISSNPDVKEESIPYDEIVVEKIRKIGKGAMAMKGARAKEDMTQKELSKKLGVDQAIVSKIENGKLKITSEISKKLGKLFNINFKVFLQ